MTSSARTSYLTTEVLTAAPQKLHRMLIEAAIRFIQQARQHWRANQADRACEAVLRAEDVVAELMAGLSRDAESDLVRKTAAIYEFVFRTLMEVNSPAEDKKLEDVLRVLEIQRETWSRVCDEIGEAEAAGKPRPDEASLQDAFEPRPASASPHVASMPAALQSPGGFSVDA